MRGSEADSLVRGHPNDRVEDDERSEPKPVSKKRKKILKQMHQKDVDYFHTTFKELPETEIPIDSFSCALHKEILIHGRLYVSQNYFAFHSNIFGWATHLVVPCSDVVHIRKERVALVFPNAINLCTMTDCHFFASFVSRDTAYRCLWAVWQNAQRPSDQRMSLEQLRATYARDWHPLLISPTNEAAPSLVGSACGSLSSLVAQSFVTVRSSYSPFRVGAKRGARAA